MSDETPSVGGETQAYCTSCKTMREHVIVAMVGDKPAKVECDECHKQHLYRSGPPGTKPKSGPRKRAADAAPAPPPIDLAAITAGRPRRGYDPKTRFTVGEVVEHPSFGVGLVTLVPGPQKVEIAFQVGSKLLAHDRGAPSPNAGLARPTPRVDPEGSPKMVSDAPARKL